ncbi:MAG: RNA 3'-terminal phosphate cyclase [Haloferacaceae archaeon]
MIELDGSGGGGQVLRSALAFAALTGEPFHATGIRGGRPEPGLRPQHLAAVELVGDVCDAAVSDAAVGSRELTFRPGPVGGGRYTAAIGTAGSVALLFDAVLPLAAAVEDPLVVVARGGTDVKWAPTMAYYRTTKLPLLRRHGLHAVVEVDRPGFYPVGGGRATLRVAPSTLSRFDLTARGAFAGARIHSLAAPALAEAEVAERQAARATARLDDAGLAAVERTVRYADADSPGSAVAVRLDYGDALAGFDALGERGTPAETVAETAVADALAFHGGTAAVDRHAADQVLPFLALAGGRMRIPEATEHVETGTGLLAAFGFEASVERDGDGVVVEA